LPGRLLLVSAATTTGARGASAAATQPPTSPPPPPPGSDDICHVAVAHVACVVAVDEDPAAVVAAADPALRKQGSEVARCTADGPSLFSGEEEEVATTTTRSTGPSSSLKADSSNLLRDLGDDGDIMVLFTDDPSSSHFHQHILTMGRLLKEETSFTACTRVLLQIWLRRVCNRRRIAAFDPTTTDKLLFTMQSGLLLLRSFARDRGSE
jgi:hypothetical protein